MTQDELAVLMGWAAGVDQYFPAADKDVLDGWFALLQDVPREVAAEALRAHYRTTKETITPADIAFVWREKRRHLALAELPAEQRPNPRQSTEQIQAGVDRALGMLVARKALGAGEDRDTALAIAQGEMSVRRLYRSVPCPWPECKAEVGQPCVTSRGQALTKSPAHPARVEAARVAARVTADGSFRA